MKGLFSSNFRAKENLRFNVSRILEENMGKHKKKIRVINRGSVFLEFSHEGKLLVNPSTLGCGANSGSGAYF